MANIIVGIIIIVTAFFYHPTDANSVNLHVSRWFIILSFGLLLLLFLLFKQKKYHQLIIKKNPIYALFALFFLWATLSIIWTNYSALFLFKWLLISSFFIYFILSNWQKHSLDAINNLLLLLLLGGSFVALLGIGQYLFVWDFILQTAPPAGTLGNKNMTAHIMVLILPLGFYLFIYHHQKIMQFLAILASLLIVIYIFYTKTRSAWLGVGLELLLVMIYYFIYKPPLTKQQKVLLLVSLGFFLLMINISSTGWTFVFGVISDRVNDTLTTITNTKGSSQSGRYTIWLAALEMIKNSPILGSGLGSFFANLTNEGYATYQTQGVKRAHNDFLELIVELGLIGFLLFLAIIVTLIKQVKQLLVQLKDKYHFLVFVLTLALFSSSINAVFSFPYQMILPMSIAGVYIGLLFNIHHQFDKKLADITLNIKQYQWYILAIIPSALLIMTIYSYGVYDKNSSQTEKIIISAQKNQSTTSVDKPTLYQLFYLNKLNSMVRATNNNGHYYASEALLNQAQVIFPNDFLTCLSITYAQIRQKRYTTALKTLNYCEKHAFYGSFTSDIIRLNIYKKIGDQEKIKQVYQNLSQKPENLLAIQPDAYKALTITAILLNKPKDVINFYQKFNQYHAFNKLLALKVLQFDFNHKHYQLSIKLIDKLIKTGHKFDAKLLQFLRQVYTQK